MASAQQNRSLPSPPRKTKTRSAPPPPLGLAPLERFKVPRQLDGAKGTFRGTKNALTAKRDLDAVHVWLDKDNRSTATYRAYRKEVERLLLWAILLRRRALSSLTHEDARAFAKFLSAPPRAWIGSVDKRDAQAWRPFRQTAEKATQRRSGQTLDARSIRHAVTIISGMFAWMVEKGYVTANPFVQVRTKDEKEVHPIDWADERSFTQAQWKQVLKITTAYKHEKGMTEAKWMRLTFLLEFLHATGLRLSEIAKARMQDLYTDDNGWHWLRVQGKGRKIGKVSVPPSAYRALMRYLRYRSLRAQADVGGDSEPLLASVQANRMSEGIKATQTAGLLRDFFRFAAKRTADRKLKDKLGRASTHWMRHTHATHAIERRVPLTIVRDNLRHDSIATTSRYVNANRDAQARAMKSAFG